MSLSDYEEQVLQDLERDLATGPSLRRGRWWMRGTRRALTVTAGVVLLAAGVIAGALLAAPAFLWLPAGALAGLAVGWRVRSAHIAAPVPPTVSRHGWRVRLPRRHR